MKSLIIRDLLIWWLVGPAGAQPGVPVISLLPQLQDSLRRVMAREHIPGLMLTLVSHDSVLFCGGAGVGAAGVLALCLLLVLSSNLAALASVVLALRRDIPQVQVLPRLLPLPAIGALVATLVASAATSGRPAT